MDFLRSKASNFREYLKSEPQTPESEALLNSYNEAELETLIKTHLLPLYFLGQLDKAAEKILEVFPAVDGSRVQRYLLCFCECILKANIG